MPENVLQQRLYPYDGSQDSTRHPILISPTDITDSDNIIYTTYSTKKKRPGISEAWDTRPPGNLNIIGGVDYWRLGTQYVVYYDGYSLYAVSSSGVWTSISSGIPLPVNETVSFTRYNGLLITFFGGAATPPKKWTQTGVVSNLGTDVPYAAFGRVWLNRLWVPDPSVPGRVAYSRTGDPTAFTGGDSGTIDLDVSDGDPDGITAIFPPFFGGLYVAKRLSIYKIEPVILSDGSIIFSQVKILDGIGCNSHNAVVAVESNIIFTSDRGIHLFQSTDKISGVETQFLSASIQPDWVGGVNFRRAKYMQAVYDTELNSYILIFPRAGRNYPTDVWGYSLAANKWYRWRDYNQTAIFRYIDFNNKKAKTMIGSNSGDFGFIDTSTNKDYGNQYSIYIESGIISPISPDEQFTFESITPIFVPQSSGEFTLKYKIDGRVVDTLTFDMTDDSLGDPLGEFILGESYLGGVPNVKVDKRNIGGNGMFYQLIISHKATGSNDEGFELLGILTDIDNVSKATGVTVA